jgi:Tol biopolymer transport system component/DNA-binding winged helix-turn-helix (wHTH) protein
MANSEQRLICRFEDFEVDLEAGEVWKAGRRLKVQDQPLKILAALLHRPGEIVTREELRQLIWPEQSVGDFDHAINLAITKLRSTLGDSAVVPHLIETLPRRGYRFIAPLKEKTAPSSAHPIPTVEEPPARASVNKVWLISGALALILFSAIAFLKFFPRHREPSQPAGEMVPLVSMPGVQAEPAVSPDGRQVAFRYMGASHPGIYIALVGGEKPLQLTENEDDMDPAWSPDGRQIAFARVDPNHRKNLYVVPALGGLQRHIGTMRSAFFHDCNTMSWSPDGKFLVFSEALENWGRVRLSLLSLSDLTSHPLTSPQNQEFDCYPAFSPDGSSIAFASGPIGAVSGDLFVVKVDGGQPSRLTSNNSGGPPAWTEDGTEIIYSSSSKGAPSLWRIPASGGTPQRVAAAGADAYYPSISHTGNQLAYQALNQWDTIWRLDLKDERHAKGPPVRLLSGRGGTWRPSYSPDGKKIAFESDRMGYSDIWMCDSDGFNCVQLTSLHGLTGTARWSPDGRYISFETIAQDYYHVGLIELPDGTPHMLATFPGENTGAPSWSRDGAWLYFYSSHEPTSFQLWKMPIKGGPPRQVTTKGGVHGIESSDGQFLYYAKYTEGGIWKRSLQTGEESYLPLKVDWWTYWTLAPGGIYYYQDRTLQPNGSIDYFDFATGQSTQVFALEKPFAGIGGLAVSPDGKSLLFGQNERYDSYIMLLKNFH